MKHGYHFLAILLVLLLSFEKPHNTEALIGRISALGHRLKQNELPFVAALSYKDDQKTPEQNQFCTGTLVSPQHILTSKHCALNLKHKPSEILIGSPSLRSSKKYQWVKTLSYADWAIRNNRSIDPANDDIAVVKLKEKIVHIKPATLRAAPHGVKPGLLLMVGWGDVGLERVMKPVEARKITVRVLNIEECKRLTSASSPDELSITAYNWDRRICTGNRVKSGYALLADGDSGGPLVDKNNYVIGVNNHAVPDNLPFEDQVNLHCTVRFYRDFIHDAQLSDSVGSSE